MDKAEMLWKLCNWGEGEDKRVTFEWTGTEVNIRYEGQLLAMVDLVDDSIRVCNYRHKTEDEEPDIIVIYKETDHD